MRTMRRLAAVIAVGLALTLAGSTGAQARGKAAATRPHLVRQHDCHPYDTQPTKPIVGILADDLSTKRPDLSYHRIDNWTQGWDYRTTHFCYR